LDFTVTVAPVISVSVWLELLAASPPGRYSAMAPETSTSSPGSTVGARAAV
jgi:hypothetical protein